MSLDVSERWVDEGLGLYWQVDAGKESFDRLKYHLKVQTRFEEYFLESTKLIPWSDMGDDVVGVDFGAGVGWTSGLLLSQQKTIKKLYCVEPSKNRMNRINDTVAHYSDKSEKISAMPGTFTDFHLPEKVDFVMLTGAFHHGLVDELNKFFEKIVSYKRTDKLYILIANEHYVNQWFVIQSICSYIKNYKQRHALWYGPGKWLQYRPTDHEHTRKKSEVEAILKRTGGQYTLVKHPESLCARQLPLLQRYRLKLSMKYYHCLLVL